MMLGGGGITIADVTAAGKISSMEKVCAASKAEIDADSKAGSVTVAGDSCLIM